jgi:hypothetical protein
MHSGQKDYPYEYFSVILPLLDRRNVMFSFPGTTFHRGQRNKHDVRIVLLANTFDEKSANQWRNDMSTFHHMNVFGVSVKNIMVGDRVFCPLPVVVQCSYVVLIKIGNHIK